MAKKFLFMDVDIAFPDNFVDDDYAGENLVPPAVALQEVRKIIESGAGLDSFDMESSYSGKSTRNGASADMLVDLVAQ